MKALVLSAGGMFGAYQAGAWRELADVFQPDLIVGASIGAVNAWAIAGGCGPEELVDRWLNLDTGRYRWKAPSGVFKGVLNSDRLQEMIREVHASFQPRTDCAIVLTDLLRLRPRIFKASEVSWQHLVASTAIIGIFDQVRLGGRVYSDGGLLTAVPLWAAAELGATQALVIDLLPVAPSPFAKAFVGAVRRLSSFEARVPAGIEVIRVTPPGLLGTPGDLLYWKRANAEKWILDGRRDALAIKHSISNCFERE